MLFLKFSFEYERLKFLKLVIVKQSVHVFVADSEYAKQCSLILRLDLTFDRIEKGCDGEANGTLGAENNV